MQRGYVVYIHTCYSLGKQASKQASKRAMSYHVHRLKSSQFDENGSMACTFISVHALDYFFACKQQGRRPNANDAHREALLKGCKVYEQVFNNERETVEFVDPFICSEMSGLAEDRVVRLLECTCVVSRNAHSIHSSVRRGFNVLTSLRVLDEMETHSHKLGLEVGAILVRGGTAFALWLDRDSGECWMLDPHRRDPDLGLVAVEDDTRASAVLVHFEEKDDFQYYLELRCGSFCLTPTQDYQDIQNQQISVYLFTSSFSAPSLITLD